MRNLAMFTTNNNIMTTQQRHQKTVAPTPPPPLPSTSLSLWHSRKTELLRKATMQKDTHTHTHTTSQQRSKQTKIENKETSPNSPLLPLFCASLLSRPRHAQRKGWEASEKTRSSIFPENVACSARLVPEYFSGPDSKEPTTRHHPFPDVRNLRKGKPFFGINI